MVNFTNPIEHNINTHYLPALINDDSSSMEDSEEEKLNSYVDQHFTGKHLSYPDDCNEAANFSRCDVTGLYGNCVTITVYDIE